MRTTLQVVLAIDAVWLVTLILLQNRGVALSSTFGGSDSSVNYQRRGAEKVLHYLTIAAAVIFVGVAFGILFV
ncbi:MAG TPA: preprotein translocase subunit SecG [Patescibacteria group bacterium]|jgi:protein translocase SecG subunit